MAQQDSAFPPLHAVDRANFDTTCAPCRDFFGYVNGGWLARTTIPPQYSITGVDRDIQDRTEALLHRILDKAARDAKNTTDATPAESGCFTEAAWTRFEWTGRGEAAGEPARQIAAIRSRAQLVGVMAELEREGVDGPIAYFAYPNFKNSR
jgi:putative endopeptidase